MAGFFDPSDILEAQRDVEELMLDTCIVDRPGMPETNPETGAVTPVYTLVYSGRCRVQQTQAQSSSPEAGGAVFTVLGSRLDIPVGAGPVVPGDRVRMLASPSNPALVGNVYRIVETSEKSFQTAQRLRVEELA